MFLVLIPFLFKHSVVNPSGAWILVNAFRDMCIAR